MLAGACFMAVLAMSIMLQMVVVFDYTLDAVQHFFVSVVCTRNCLYCSTEDARRFAL